MSKTLPCHACGQPIVELGEVGSTLLGYGDSPCGGEHDRNCVNRSAWCASGHCNLIGLRRTCNDHEPERTWGRDVGDSTPKCDWRGPESCNICRAHHMVDAWPELPERNK